MVFINASVYLPKYYVVGSTQFKYSRTNVFVHEAWRREIVRDDSLQRAASAVYLFMQELQSSFLTSILCF